MLQELKLEPPLYRICAGVGSRSHKVCRSVRAAVEWVRRGSGLPYGGMTPVLAVGFYFVPKARKYVKELASQVVAPAADL